MRMGIGPDSSAVLGQHVALELLGIGHARGGHDAHAPGELIAVELLSFELHLGQEGIEHAFVQWAGLPLMGATLAVPPSSCRDLQMERSSRNFDSKGAVKLSKDDLSAVAAYVRASGHRM